MSEYVIETKGLTVYYGRHRGIENVDLQVEKGEVFGFLGPNGAGKTTMERTLLDIIRPSAGEALLFGNLDSRKDGVEARQRIGYLPGELSLYADMTASAYFKMYHALQGGNDTYWQTLADRLGLDSSRKIRNLSRGNKQKVGIVAAFMNKPELLILDEPTGGLDPLVQQTVIELVREAREGGATVFFSSHILPEVQAVCDRVGIIREGQLVAVKRVEELIRQQFQRVQFTFGTIPPADAFVLDGVTELRRDGNVVMLEIRENLNAVLTTAVAYTVTNIDIEAVSLEDIFLAYYGKGEGHA